MSDPSQPMSAPSEASPPAKPAALWEDFIDIFYAPSEVFARRANANFFVPLLIVTVLFTAIFLAGSSAMQPIMDGEFSRNMAAVQKKNPSITAEQLQSMRSIGEKFAKVGAFFIIPVITFMTGLFLWIVGKFVDAKQALGAALVVAAYANITKVVSALVGGLQLLVLDSSTMTSQYNLSLGPARFFDPDATSPILMVVLGRLDVFTIWTTILLGIGLAVTGKIPRSRAMIAAVLLWIIGGLPQILGAARQ